MAKLIAGEVTGGIDMSRVTVEDYKQLTFSTQSPTLTVGDYRTANYPQYVVQFEGSGFTYGSPPKLPIDGTATRILETFDGKTALDLTEVSISMQAFNGWLSSKTGAVDFVTSVLGGNDYIQGTSFADVLAGFAGNDRIKGGAGADFIDGGDGLDVAEMSGARSAYTVAADANTFKVNGPDGNDVLRNVERIDFDGNQMLGLDISGNGGQGYRLYQAAFDRIPDEAGLGFWIAQLDAGKYDLIEISARFIDSPEFRSLYGQNPTTAEFVTAVYTNVLNRAPDQAGLNFYVNQIDSGAKSVAKVLADFSESPENQQNVIGAIANGFKYELWI
jgi:hypothetical protein